MQVGKAGCLGSGRPGEAVNGSVHLAASICACLQLMVVTCSSQYGPLQCLLQGVAKSRSRQERKRCPGALSALQWTRI
jgi:hypothetical protein